MSQNLNFAVPSNFLQPLLRTFEIEQVSTSKTTPPDLVWRPWDGLSVSKTTGQLGVQIVKIHEKSEAFAKGLRIGDVVIGLDDKEIRKPDDYWCVCFE